MIRRSPVADGWYFDVASAINREDYVTAATLLRNQALDLRRLTISAAAKAAIDAVPLPPTSNAIPRRRTK